MIVPKSTWAVFYDEGPVIKMQELETRIVTEWLPTSGYEYANAPEIELYLNPDPEQAKYEIWLPIVRKGRIQIRSVRYEQLQGTCLVNGANHP